MSLNKQALKEAHRCVGIMEHGGNNKGREVMRIIRENGGTGPEAWCGDFVAHCYRVARSQRVTRLWAAVRYLGRIPGTRTIPYPRGGDIVVYTFDHTGIVVTYCDQYGNKRTRRRATHIKAIEGNTGASGAVSDSKTGGDGVYIKIRPLTLVERWVKVTG